MVFVVHEKVQLCLVLLGMRGLEGTSGLSVLLLLLLRRLAVVRVESFVRCLCP